MSQLILERGVKSNVIAIFAKRFNVGPYFLAGSFITVISMITVITLTFSARQVTKGYVLSQLEVDNQSLLKEADKIDMQIADVKALSYIRSTGKVAGMVRPNVVAYTLDISSVASNF